MKIDADVFRSDANLERWYWHGLWALVAVRLVAAAIVLSSGYTTIWPDDGCRYDMARGILADFRYSPGDHVWPAGAQYVLTAFLAVARDFTVGLRVHGLFFSIACVLLAGTLARRLSGSRLGGLATAAFVASQPMNLWLGTGAMTEVPCLCLLFAALHFGLGAYDAQGGRRMALAALAGLMATIACSFRYEAWMCTAAVGGSAGIAAVVLRLRGTADGASLLRAAVVTGACSSLFPFLWMISSWKYLGHPLQFFRNQNAMNAVFLEKPLTERLLVYPDQIAQQMGSLAWWLPVCIVVALAMVRVRPRMAAYTFAVLVFGAIFIGLSAKKGTGVSVERYASQLLTLLAPALAAPVALGGWLRHRRGAPARSTGWVLLLGGLAITGAQVRTHLRAMDRYQLWGFRNESFLAGALLAREMQLPQLLPGLARGGSVVFWHPETPDPAHLWHVPMMTLQADRVRFLSMNPLPPDVLEQEHLSILCHAENPPPLPASFIVVGRIGQLTVYRRVEDTPQ